MPRAEQIEINFEPGITRQFPDLLDLVAATVYGSRIGLGGVASSIDKSPSLLSRMLSRHEDDLRHLPLADLPRIIAATGDHRPVYWLIETFLEDSETRRKNAIDDLTRLMPHLQSIVKSLK